MQISDILRAKGQHVVTIRPDETVKDAVERLAANHIGALVVEDRLKPVGMFSERDLVNRLATSGIRAYGYQVRELMSSPLVTGKPDDTVEHATAVMTERRIRHLPIMVDGDLVGLVSLGDLVKYRLGQKELEANVLLDITRLRG